jgi:hypothetical protein
MDLSMSILSSVRSHTTSQYLNICEKIYDSPYTHDETLTRVRISELIHLS